MSFHIARTIKRQELTHLIHALQLVAEQARASRSPVRNEKTTQRKKLQEEASTEQKAVAIDAAAKDCPRQIDARPAHGRSRVIKPFLPRCKPHIQKSMNKANLKAK